MCLQVGVHPCFQDRQWPEPGEFGIVGEGTGDQHIEARVSLAQGHPGIE
jgi:hypothetical protein